MNALLADLRVGVRLLWRDKAFTVTAGLTLAVCIGANVAFFSVIRGVLLRPLAMPDADRVVIAGNAYPGAGVHDPIGAAVTDYFDRLLPSLPSQSRPCSDVPTGVSIRAARL